MAAYYNEVDPFAAQWLRNLIAAGHIAPGEVDERDIRDVSPADLIRFRQCHFFAGIGGWSRALRLAGIPDDEPVWTGSCPCQPFSAAGSGGGFTDERHLWPHWFHLIGERRPSKIYGEQVASPDALEWFDLVCADLENAGYAVGIADIGAAGVGAPHIRQRLYFVADAYRDGCDQAGRSLTAPGNDGIVGNGSVSVMGHAFQSRLEGLAGHGDGTAGREIAPRSIAEASDARGMADAERHGPYQARGNAAESRGDGPDSGLFERGGQSVCGTGPGALNGFWRAADWLACRDGKWRPVEPGTFPLAHGIPGRVGRLRAYGNAIVPPLAAEFIRATL